MKPIFRLLTTSRWIGGAALAGVLAVLLLCSVRSPAEEEITLRQGNPGSVIYWEPIISKFYLVSKEATQKVTGETVDLGSNPPPHFTLIPPPADQAPTLSTDWGILQRRLYQNNEPASAWFVSWDFRGWEGRPRLVAHGVFDEECLVGYMRGERYYILLRLDVDVPKAKLPALEGLTGEERRQKLYQGIKVVEARLILSRLNGVSLRGRGGTLVDPPESSQSFTQPISTLEQFVAPQFALKEEYIPPMATSKEGDNLNGVLNVAAKFVLEVGPELGLNPPQQKTVQGEIRVGIWPVGFNVDVLSSKDETTHR